MAVTWLLVPFIAVLGQIVGKKEGWLPFESFYWSFITATTVGYGDIRPTRRSPRVLSTLIGFAGLLFSGILVAVAVHSETVALAATAWHWTGH
jgi:voltage-gated potassium channel